MKTLEINLDEVKYYGDLSVTIGFFDGVHLGHQKLINLMISYGNKNNLLKTIITFQENPASFLSKDKSTHVIMPIDEKLLLFSKMGVDLVLIIKSEIKNYSMTYEDFIEKFLNKIGTKKLFIGFDFHFGLKGLGSVIKLENCKFKNFSLFSLEKQELDHLKISSSNIREYLNEGKIEEANKMLGRFYAVKGKVEHGKELGRTIGFPTANIHANLNIYPKCGVYLVSVKITSFEYIGICNIGCRPTVSKNEDVNLEVHILDFSEDIYDKEIKVSFIEHLRDERKFANIDALIKQLRKDKDYAIKRILK